MSGPIKRSGSRMLSLSSAKGSMSHIGTTPCKYNFDVFVSYVEPIKTAEEVCVVWERRGKTVSTKCVKVKDNKAVFRETLSMDLTLFKRSAKGKHGVARDVVKFDEKKTKICLKKGGPDGKTVGKIHLNLADYVKGISGTVFVDLKMSNGSVAVTKIDCMLLHTNRKKRNGSQGSDVYSEMADDAENNMDNDSIFGDDVTDLGDVDILELGSRNPPTKALSSTGSSPAKSQSSKMIMKHFEEGCQVRGNSNDQDTENESSMDHDESSRLKMKKFLSASSSKRLIAKKLSRKGDFARDSENQLAKIDELQAKLRSLEVENRTLKRSCQRAKKELSKLRADMQQLEAERKSSSDKPARVDSELNKQGKGGVQDHGRKEFEIGNEELTGELGDQREIDKRKQASRSLDARLAEAERMNEMLRRKVDDLEIALRREPQYLAVVDELKVVKMSLALANMEKEQALFALKKIECESPTSVVTASHSAASEH